MGNHLCHETSEKENYAMCRAGGKGDRAPTEADGATCRSDPHGPCQGVQGEAVQGLDG